MYPNGSAPRVMSPQSTRAKKCQQIQTSTITRCPSPLCVSPVTTSSGPEFIGGVVDSCATGCETTTPQDYKSILQENHEESTLKGPSDDLYLPLSTASLLSGFSDRKSRRKMVMRPVSCNMFWDQGTPSEDFSAAEGSNAVWDSTHDTSPAMKLAYFDSFTTQSETPLTTPGSNGILSGTQTRQDPTPSAHFPFLEAMRSNRRTALRPTIIRTASLPTTPNSRPKTSRGILNAGKGFQGLSGSVVTGIDRPVVDESTSVDNVFEHLERINVPSATDVVRFGKALNGALDSYLDRLREITEEVERLDESYWSDSESETSDVDD
ncbi:uncharacterized protein MELLADRAFT_71246 [Melampsora larici-populina 98AG31]|uniref:Uncharacterized protein n=1 Tax=Melampsora larici-populina (strain 98AG31 / pathotype 3-4-7) TaxID=747676 RepID=F4RDZ0_MELLP|nr:uncharacterized protein MELLADRAFT_71246 [Melampsora larici-populina 98AG31]EGG09529.1 hypothetical protein MELLADRAFT_71246 [Melampsora larici-populina 98AG31]